MNQSREKRETPAERQRAVSATDVGGASPAMSPAIDVARKWLKRREKWDGHISTWTPEQIGNYHRDLGLLVDFVTDHWPNGTTEQP